MASVFYVNNVTVIDAAPMNDYDSTTYDHFGDGTNYDGVLRTTRTASSYVYTAWDPSDVAGTVTNASSSSSATSPATDYITVANSSGTTTWTCVKAGVYRFTIYMHNEAAAAVTAFRTKAVIGGSGTPLLGTPTIVNCNNTLGIVGQNVGGTAVFYATMTAAQTITVLPTVEVVSAGVTTNFTQQCTVSAEYTGTP